MTRNLSKLVLVLMGGLLAASGTWAADCTSVADKSKAECTAPAPRAVTVKVLDAASGLVMKEDGQTIILEHTRPAPVRQDPMIRVRYNAAEAPQMVTLSW